MVRSASFVRQVVGSQLSISHYLMEESFPQITLTVDGNGCSAAIGMDVHGVTSRLPIQRKAVLYEDGNNLAGI